MAKKILKILLVCGLLAVVSVSTWLFWKWQPYPGVDSVIQAAPAEDVLGNELRTALLEQMVSYRETHNIPSISAAIGVGNAVVFAAAAGYADLASEQAATTESLYRIGSVSKSITAAALGRQLELGQLELDDEISEFVPSFPAKRWPFTLRQLASHTAGIRHYQENSEMYVEDHYASVADALHLVAEDPLLFEPGTDFNYSSYGYNLLSAAMASASQQPFTDLLAQLVFEPAGMQDTRAEDPRQPGPDDVSYYFLAHKAAFPAPYVDNSYKLAGGGLVGTPSDLVRFGLSLAAGEIVSAETLDTLWTIATLSDGTPSPGNYGLGFGVGETELAGQTLREVGHSGGSIGGITAFRIFPSVQTPHGVQPVVLAVTMNISTLGSEASAWDVLYGLAYPVIASF